MEGPFPDEDCMDRVRASSSRTAHRFLAWGESIDLYVNVRYVGLKRVPRPGEVCSRAMSGQVYSITQLCQEFDVTPRTIRHYESCGLVQPAREGQRRLFSERDRVRLRLVLRGRSLGFNLAEIAEMIDLYDLDPTQVAQLERTLAYGRDKIRSLERKCSEITEAIEELRAWERRLEAQLRLRKRQQTEGKR